MCEIGPFLKDSVTQINFDLYKVIEHNSISHGISLNVISCS